MKQLLLFICLFLNLGALCAEPIDEAQTQWKAFQGQKGPQADILEFVESLKDPKVLLAATSTGLSAGLDPNPSPARLNRLIQKLRQLRLADEDMAAHSKNENPFIIVGKKHQFSNVIGFWGKMDPFDMTQVSLTEIQNLATPFSLQAAIGGNGSVVISNVGVPMARDNIELIGISELNSIRFDGTFNSGVLNKILLLAPFVDNVVCDFRKTSVGDIPKYLRELCLDLQFMNIEVMLPDNFTAQGKVEKTSVKLGSVKFHGTASAKIIKDIFRSESTLQELYLTADSLEDEDLDFLKNLLPHIEKLTFSVPESGQWELQTTAFSERLKKKGFDQKKTVLKGKF